MTAVRTSSELAADMRGLGVRPGDTLMVHASLRKIGPVEGGASGVIAALDEAVGPDGTLLMILGAEIEHEWVNKRPEEEREALLANVAPYDPFTAPALPEVGYLAEAFRVHPGTIVTTNPSGRFAARGGRAEELLRNAPWDDYYGPDSPLERLCNLGGRVLRMGANPETVTMLHFAEYLADVRGKRRVRRHYRVMDPQGPMTRSVECLNDEFGIVRTEGEDYFAIIVKAYLGEGRAKLGKIGHADSELIDAQDIVDYGARWMTENLPALSTGIRADAS
jgi:aminoglycoside N3'-acetyltransferase